MEKLQSLRATYLSRKVASKCEVCAKEFGLTRLRHLCKRCNRIICASCGSTRRTVVTFDLKTTHKVCPICEIDQNFQTTLMDTDKTHWGKMSVVGRLWKDKCLAKEGRSVSKQETYGELLEVASKMDENDKDMVIIEKDVLSGRSDREVFNYSMQEFLYYNQEGVPLDEIQAKIARVLKAFCVRHPTIGYCQGMNYMTCFLLSLIDEESVFIVLNYVVTKLLPQNYYTQTTQGSALMGFHQEKFVLYSLAKQRLDLDESTAEKVKLFLDVNGPSFLIPLFVNYLNFQVLFMMWNEMIMKDSINEVRKVALYMIEMLIEKIKSDNLEKSADLANMLINMFTVDRFMESKKIEINNEEVLQLEDEFKRTYSSKWVSHDAYVYHTLQKHTHFKKDEIKLLQEQYTKFVEANQLENKTIDGVNEQQLREIVFLTTTDDEKKQHYLDSLDFKNLFKIFDIDNTGYLDFKEFLSCLSMLTRGNLLEKTEAAFQIFDKDEKGYLTIDEYNGFIKSIIEASKGMLTDQSDLMEEDIQKFEGKLQEISKRKNRIQIMDIKTALFSDDFVEMCDNADYNRVRGATIAHIQNSLNTASPKIGPVPIEEEDEDEL